LRGFSNESDAKGFVMVTSAKPMTAQTFASLDSSETFDELIRGALIQMPPPGARHGRLQARLARLLSDYVETDGRGTVVSGSGIWIQTEPDTVFAPDVAVFLGTQAAAIDEPEGYERRIPLLVVEIISPSDTFSMVEDKIMTYLDAGVPAVVTVDPRRTVVSIYGQARNIRTLDESDVWDDPELLPGFSLPVARIFE
jgi:Uma2 family endonuclease